MSRFFYGFTINLALLMNNLAIIIEMINLRLVERCRYPFCEEYHKGCELNYALYHGGVGLSSVDEIMAYRPFDYLR